MGRIATGAAGIAASLLLAAGPALAHECTNAARDSHDPSKGAQIIFGCGDGDIISAKKHAIKVMEAGGFPSGWIAFDVDCDGVADAGTYIVGPMGELPEQAQAGGSTTNGVMNICTYFGLPDGCTDG
ncbi:MAG TPA: hypothetical protein VFJ85_17140 [Acidimicrobiales bacterium]|nr:hypothetical protein [Acidimicrobiales bacterium]